MKKFGFILISILFLSCKNNKAETPKVDLREGKLIEIKYAKGFSIEEFEGYSIMSIQNPWPGAEDNFTYLLAKKNAVIPAELKFNQKVIVPISKIIVTSTTHIPTLEALNEEKKLLGFPGLDYISSQKTRALIKNNKIQELGQNENINTEVLINLQPDVVVAFAIDGNNKNFETIQKAGIPVLYNGDWTEADPLGKAEWIKFFGALFDKNKEAKTIFNEIETAYNTAKKLAEKAPSKPNVLSGSMFKDQWYLPYGNSWQAKFIEDANANYLYADTEGHGSISLSFESVLDKAQEADIWISTGQFSSYQQLMDESSHYAQFKAVKDKNVYSVSLSKGETGGIIYFELGPHRPDLILKDHISIFHPDLLPNYTPTFFKNLQD